jgi:hypothetical protein
MSGHLLTALALAVAASAASAADSPLLPVDQKVAGASQSEWSRAWWQWAASFEMSESPASDRTGERCGARQQGAVWFLAGTYGSPRTQRACSVPSGKYLFFPLINYVAVPPADADVGCQDVVDAADERTQGVSNLVLRIDGQPQAGLEAHRVTTQGCFDAGALTRPHQAMFPAAGNGWYVMLKPLAPGRHTIDFGGRLAGNTQAISYTLDVK